MDISIFSRGIKLSTAARFGPVEEVPAPAKAKVLLRQGATAPCKPLVEKGSEVKAGQKIGEAVDPQAVDVHTPFSGIVEAIEEVLVPDGGRYQAVVIAVADGETEETSPAVEAPLSAGAQDLIEAIRGAGIVTSGRGGKGLATILEETVRPKGFNAATGSAMIKPVDNLAVRFIDVDPHLGTMITATGGIGDDTAELKFGIDVLAHLTGAANVHLVMGRKQEADGVEKMADEADWPIHRIEHGQYPFADDPFVAKKVSGKEPPISFKSVHESGTLVLDVSEVLSVAAALGTGAPVTRRVITVLGPSGPRMCKAGVGTPVSEVIAAVGLEAEYGKVVLQGPMGGAAIPDLAYPVTKDLVGITLVPRGEVAAFENEPCVSCGLCAMVCPSRLVPGMLSRYCEFGQLEAAQEAHLFSCTECGCCAYVCPAGRSMVQFMIHGKTELLAARRAG